MNPKTFYVGVKGVVCVDGKCLLLKRVKTNETHWDFPGGRMQDAESIEETLRRELAEELPSLKEYEIGTLLGAYRLPKDLADGNGLLFLMYQINAKPFEVRLSEEHAAYQWVTENDIPALQAETSIRIQPLDQALLAVFHA